jgi:putative FmdB family regulatory protein
MPIYEFYCPRCHKIFSFRSARVDTETRPRCPGCSGDTLERRVSRFAVTSSSRGSGDDDTGLPVDEARMERALDALGGDLDKVDEHDPRALARFMRRFSQETGMDFGERYEEAVRRLERGEDPDAVEADLPPESEGDDDITQFFRARVTSDRRSRPPARDDTLYDM